MPTIVEILRKDPETIPNWLNTDGEPCFQRERFFASRTVYYPGSGDDGQPVKLCARSHAAHCCVYVDYDVGQHRLLQRLHNPDAGFAGYEPIHEQSVSEEVLRPGGWKPHVSAAEYSHAVRLPNHLAEPFGLFVVLSRQAGFTDDHGPRRQQHRTGL